MICAFQYNAEYWNNLCRYIFRSFFKDMIYCPNHKSRGHVHCSLEEYREKNYLGLLPYFLFPSLIHVKWNTALWYFFFPKLNYSFSAAFCSLWYKLICLYSVLLFWLFCFLSKIDLKGCLFSLLWDLLKPHIFLV